MGKGLAEKECRVPQKTKLGHYLDFVADPGLIRVGSFVFYPSPGGICQVPDTCPHGSLSGQKDGDGPNPVPEKEGWERTLEL